MRHIPKIFVLLLFVTGFFYPGTAQSVNMHVVEERAASVTVLLELQNYSIDELRVNGIPCSRITLREHATYLEKGMPELPLVGKSVIVADKGAIEYEVLETEEELRRVNTVMPSKGNFSRSIDPATVPFTFSDFYTKDEWWPARAVLVSSASIMRDFRCAHITFNPFRYNPAKKQLKITTKVLVRISTTGQGGKNTLDRPRVVATREFLNIYQEHFLNFSPARYDTISEKPGRMIILSPSKYIDVMEDLVYWKKLKGIPTTIKDVSSIGHSPSSIKRFIQEEYDKGDLVWILLVGDGDEVVPVKGDMGDAKGKDADPVYAYTKGDDYYPDLFISRFSSASGVVDNIATQVSRTIGYERRPMTENNEWYHTGLNVASNESGSGSVKDYERADWLKDTLMKATYKDFKYQYQGKGGSKDGIKRDLEAGVSIVNHIGHGSANNWGSVPYLTNDLKTTNNPWKLPVVLTVACLCGDFNGKTCFGEVSQIVGSVDQPCGFIAQWAATISQNWIPPCFGQAGAVNLLAHYSHNTIGGILFNGACYMIDHYGPQHPDGIEIAQSWIIFGDASIQLRTSIPKEITVTHDPFVSNKQKFNCVVKERGKPVQEALVCCWIPGTSSQLHEQGFTDENGSISFDLKPNNENDSMFVTVTSYNAIPYEGRVPVSNTTGINPDGKVTLVIPQKPQTITLYSAAGKQVRQFQQYGGPSLSVTVRNVLKNELVRTLSPGIYLMKIQQGTHAQYIKNVYIRR